MIPVLVLLSACSVKVVSFENSGADFKSYHTFSVENPVRKADKASADSERDDRLEEAIQKQMESRGYTLSKLGDLIVEYRVLVERKSDVNIDPLRYRGYSTPYYRVSKRTYREGILMIDIYDGVTSRLAWQASLDLKINRKSKSTEGAVQASIEKIFETYPYKAGSDKRVVE